MHNNQQRLTMVAMKDNATAFSLVVDHFFATKIHNRLGKPARPQQRRSVAEIYEMLGPIYFRRAYRKTYNSFCILHNKLRNGMNAALGRSQNHQKSPPTSNGPIVSSVRLACALRS